MKNENRIVVRDIVVRFGRVVALDSFSTSISHGIVGLLGPNGAGKTTFIKVLLGLVEPQNGEFSINGKGNSEDVRDMVGYMPEDDCLIGGMNAFELVTYMAGLSGMVKDDAIQRSHAVLDFVGIGEERYREVDTYSTGMKQRVKLAQAIVHDPEILMLDEPTNGMDPDGRKDMLELISKIGRTGKTVLVSSHLLHEVEQVCQYVNIMDNGKLIRDGSIKDIVLPDKGVYRLKVRGSKKEINRFYKMLRKHHDILRITDEGAQADIILKDVKGSKYILECVKDSSVQLRYYRPNIHTLEDVFMETFEGGDEPGH